MIESRQCPALLVSAPASRQGKTTVVAALARFHRQRGRKVQVFKTGPDFLDPKIHQHAGGTPVHPLDLWMVGENQSRQRLFDAAETADLILIEGVRGLFDGAPSSADLAIRFGLPIAAVIDASAMAQTFGAVAQGLASYRPKRTFAGVIANKVASKGHGAMLQESLPKDVNWLGSLPRSEDIALPERHLGLHQADSINDLEQRLNQAADRIAQTPLAQLPPVVTFNKPEKTEHAVTALLAGLRIAVAKDEAFSFVYQANLDLLEQMGAELHFFSPLRDQALPKVDSLYLPGGYPELYLDQLADNSDILADIKHHHQQGKAIVAECGGMLYLLDSLTLNDGHCRQLVGLIPATAKMQKRLGGLGLQSANFAAGMLRGHTFHYSCFESPPFFDHMASRQPSNSDGEGVISEGGLTASYMHWYLPSNPQVAATLFSGTQQNEQPQI